MKSVPLLMILVFAALIPVVAQFERQVLPHFAADKSSFETQVMLENRTNANKLFSIRNLDSDGGFISLENIELAPGERRYLDMPEADESNPSHAVIDAADGIFAGVAYIPVQNRDHRIFVEAISNFSKRWRVYPNNWKDSFDGLVIVNPSCFSTNVDVSLFDMTGKLITVLSKEQGLASTAKWVISPEEHFEYQPGVYIEITGQEALAVMSLKGTRELNREDSFLVGNLASPVDGNEQLRLQLKENREKWQRAGFGGTYNLQMRQVCFCVPEYTAPVAIEVANFEFQSLNYVETGTPLEVGRINNFHTVESLFDFIETAMNRDAAHIYVTFHETLGYPMNVNIDWNACLADEETGIAILELSGPEGN